MFATREAKPVDQGHIKHGSLHVQPVSKATIRFGGVGKSFGVIDLHLAVSTF